MRVNIEIMRVFVHVRRMVGAHHDLADKLDALEQKYDGQFTAVFRAIRALMAPARRSPRLIGFRHGKAPTGGRQQKTTNRRRTLRP